MQMTQTPLGKKTMMIKKAPKGGTSSRFRWRPDPQAGGCRRTALLLPCIAMCMSGAATSGAGDSNL